MELGKLIDFSLEDDLLIASPLFDSLDDLRLSVAFDDIDENVGSKLSGTSLQRHKTTRATQHKEPKHLSFASIEPGRPSYTRKSLAWDNAFFTSAGILDPLELSFVNKGYNTLDEHLMPILEDVRDRRTESTSDCANLEILKKVNQCKHTKLPIHGSQYKFSATSSCREPGHRNAGLKNVAASKKIETGSRNMIISRHSRRQNIYTAKAERSKTEHTCRRGKCNSPTLKLPNVSHDLKRTVSTWQSKKSSPEMYLVDTVEKKKTGAGQDSIVSNNSSTFSSIMSCPSYETSAYASTPKNRRSEYVSSSEEFLCLSNHSSHKSPSSSTSCWSLESSSSTSSINQAHIGSSSGLTKTFGGSYVLDISRDVASGPRENSKPSGLRMPSPKSGFFDEDKSPVPTLVGNLNQSHKQGIAAMHLDEYKIAEASSNIKRARKSPCTGNLNMNTNLFQTPIVKPRCAEPLQKEFSSCSELRKVGQNAKLVGNDRTLKTKQGRERMVPKHDKKISDTPKSRNHENGHAIQDHHNDQVNDLSRYLGFIDLNYDTRTDLNKKRSFPRTRTPLADKKHVCNKNVALRSTLESSKDMVRDKVSTLPSLEGTTNKENN